MRKSMLISSLIGLTIAIAMSPSSIMAADRQKMPTQWRISEQRAMGTFADKGGYETSKKLLNGFTQTSWMGMNKAVTISGNQVVIDTAQARPSFCSSATYMLFLKTLNI
ncbi:MAG: hypothetical protein N5842_01520 [Lactobacillus crispatus]|nr:hypothetical protein [Lactobacillus crispatus]